MIDLEVKNSILHFTKKEVEEILKQFNRNFDNIEEDIDFIKSWLKTQPHLTYVPGDRVLLNVLILNKFYMEKVKSKLDYFFSMRGLLPEVFLQCDPSNKDILQMRKISRTFVLPKLLNLNRVVFLVVDEVHHTFDGYTCIANNIMNCELLINEDINNGMECVIDYTKTNFAFWRAFTPMMVKIMTTFAQKFYSSRLKAVRIIGLPSIANTLFNTALSYLPKKLQDRISFHQEPEEIAKFYPEEQLPVEYGGKGRPYHELSREFDDLMIQYEEYFKKIKDFKVDETLRPTKLDNDEMLGFHGNFRKLQVD